MLKLAKEKRVKKIIYLSSMEAYGIIDKSEKVKENELGYLDLDNIRSCYPEGKRACEMIYVKAIMQNMEFLQFKYVLHKPLVRAYIMEKIGFLHNLHEVQ